MGKKKKKKKTPKVEKGTMLLFAEPLPEETLRKMRKHFEKLPCRFDVVILGPCEIIPAEETYLGPCQWCGEEIYTKDVCPECGKMVDIS